ncbi:MAG TPA: hypothetical protein VG722_12310, partial [Tepidisphaeraceae bacterium]|nr:hypothetical protein [Tepidisphaeraceae bacterium]
AAFTSDTGDRWATAWTSWPGYGKFWSQVVRTIERGAGTTLASARIVPTNPGHAKLIVQALGDNQQFANFMNVWATLLGPDPRVPAATIQLNQTAPGTYAADIATPNAGAYLAAVHLVGAKSNGGWVDTAYVAPLSPEMRDLQSNEFALSQVAHRTGGRLLDPFDPKANLFDRAGLTEPRIATSLTNDLLAIAIILLLLDVAVRRIVFDRQLLQQILSLIPGRPHRSRQQTTIPARIDVRAIKKKKPMAEENATSQSDESAVPVAASNPDPAPPPEDSEPTDSIDPLNRLAAAKQRARKTFKE